MLAAHQTLACFFFILIIQGRYLLEVGVAHVVAVDLLRNLIIDPAFSYSLPFIPDMAAAQKVYIRESPFGFNLDISHCITGVYELFERKKATPDKPQPAYHSSKRKGLQKAKKKAHN